MWSRKLEFVANYQIISLKQTNLDFNDIKSSNMDHFKCRRENFYKREISQNTKVDNQN